jgi:UDP:flavonoid glycosyltransferase YjiC (YdhE family)
VYFGFGSMTDPDPAATTSMIVEVIERLGCRAILSEGWAGIGEGALPEGSMHIGAVPHSSLFPRVAAVVHHGGAGTTTRSAQAGVPQLIVPHLLDQFWWGRRVQELGVSPAPISRRRLNADSLQSSLRALLETEWLAERARELATRMDQAPTPDEAARRILSGYHT